MLRGLFDKVTGYHTGGVVGLRPNEVPALLTKPEEIGFISEEEDAQPKAAKRGSARNLKPGECPKIAKEIQEKRDAIAKAKIEVQHRKVAEKTKEERWDEYNEALPELQRKWDERVAELTAELPHAEPFRIWQDQESGWWRVAKRSVYIDGMDPRERATAQWRYSGMGYTPSPPEIEVGEPTVNWKFDPYEPTFKTFAEAQDWAKDTALLGKHQFGVMLNGEIAASDLEGHDHLAPAIQASRDAQKRGIERAASYEEEAIF